MTIRKISSTDRDLALVENFALPGLEGEGETVFRYPIDLVPVLKWVFENQPQW